jgi:uncharacterized protein (TIGR02145 family)
MKKITLLFAGIIILTIRNQAQTVTDKDGNIYDTVHIGKQVWLKENLATTKYNDGSPIPLVTDNTWYSLSTPAYCWYNNDSSTYKPLSGALYNWYVVNTGKLCPTGWHVPTDVEWFILIKFLDPNAGTNDCYCIQSETAGNALKSSGDVVWCNGKPLNTATNSSGFSAVGGGYRSYNCDCFEGHPAVAYFWTSTPAYPTIWNYYLSCGTPEVSDNRDFPTEGFSVRCIQGSSTTGLENISYKKELKVFPNPALDNITIDYAEKINRISIFNLLGELVYQRQASNIRNEINVSNLPNGIYIMKIDSAEGTVQQKFIKE